MEHRKNLKSSPKIITPGMITEERTLSLRKVVMKNNMILNKLKAIEEHNNHSEKSYEIKISELSFNDEYSKALINKFYEEKSQEKQIEMAITMIHPSITDSKIRQFGIKQIRNWAQTLIFNGSQSANIVEPLITEEIVDSLVLILLQNPQNPKILYETCYILIYITHLIKYTTLVVKHVKNLYQFLLSQSDQIVIKQLLWIFSHLIIEGNLIREATCSQCDLKNYVSNIIETHNTNIISLNAMAFWIFGTLLKGNECIYLIETKCIRVIPIIARYIRSQLDMNVFKEALKALKRFLGLFQETVHNTAILNMIKTLELPHYLAPFLSLKDTGIQNKNAVLRIFISLSNLSTHFAEDIIEKEVMCHLEDVLRKITANEEAQKNFINKNKKFFSRILQLIEIFSSKDIHISIKKRIVRKTKICSELITLKRIVNNFQYEHMLMTILNNFLSSNSETIITHMVVINVLELLNDSLEESSRAEILLLSMSGIKIMIEYGKDKVKNQNFILVCFESKDCGGKLEKLLSHSDMRVVACANQLLKNYFNSNKVTN